jgi:hypothetical protein
MLEAGGQGRRTPPQILADQKAPPSSGGAPNYYLPTQIFRPCNILDLNDLTLHLIAPQGGSNKKNNQE